MALVTKPFWWESLASFYGFSAGSATTIDSAEILSRLNGFVAPAPSQYEAHLKSTQGSFTSTTRLDFTVMNGAHNFIAAQGGSDYISAKAGDDVLYGNTGSDILRGGAGADLIIGSNQSDPAADRDTVSYIDSTSAITAIFSNSATTYVSADGHGSYDMLIGIENVIGSDFADRIDGQDNVNNTLIGGLGSDRLYGGGGNDMLVGGAGDDRLYGESGADIFVAGQGRDSLYLGTGAYQDRIIIDASILDNIASHRDNVYEFQAGAGGDKLDVSALLHAIGYAGSNPIADGYIKLSVMNGDDLKVQFDADGSGSAAPQHLITLLDTSISNFSATHNLVSQSHNILYAAILGQSNAKGLSTGGTDSESGVSRLKDGLNSLTDYDEIVSVLRDTDGKPVDIAVGGTTVDGNRNTSYTPDQVWWYPDENRPGEVLLRAVDLMATQIADMRTRGMVTPVVIWGQGEAETRLLGKLPLNQANVDRYIDATYKVFDFIKDRLGDDIEFYIMQTGRYNDDAARIAGESESEISLVLRGLDLLYKAQQDMALDRDDIHLAADYSDLRMLHESEPSEYPTDVWHMDYEDREIIGDRLAQFIAADMGFTNVIKNPGPYPIRALADLTIHEGGGETSGGPTVVTGTDGADRLIAGSGGEIIIGGQGKDSITLGAGQDTVVFGANLLPEVTLHSDFIAKFQAGAGGDRIDISGLLSAVGYTGNDPVADGYLRLVADGTRTKLLFDADGAGGAGARYMAMLSDVNISNFSLTENLIIEHQSSGGGSSISGKEISGSSSPDLIIGTLGDDRIQGFGGNDMIVAGAGSDTLYGGTGSDNFIFDASVWDQAFGSSASGQDFTDIIEDFVSGSGGDVINIDILLEKAGYTGTDAVGDGYVRVADSGGDALISFDRDGNGAAVSVALARLEGVSAASFSFTHNLDHSQSQMV